MQLGFSVDKIQDALIQTENRGVEPAIEYLLNNKNNDSHIERNDTQNKDATQLNASAIEDLKKRMQDMQMHVSDAMVERALRQHNSNSDKAMDWLLDEYRNLINDSEQLEHEPSKLGIFNNNNSNSNNQQQINRNNNNNNNNNNIRILNQKDAEILKQKMIEESKKREMLKEKEEKERELAIENEKIAYEKEMYEKQRKIENQKKLVAENKKKIEQKKKVEKLAKNKAKLEWHLRHEKYDAKDAQILQKISSNRNKAESQINTPQQAIDTLFQRYGEHTARC